MDLTLLRSRADGGDAVAQFNLGACFEKGQGVKQDYIKAVKYYQLFADQGNSDAQFNLGACYHNGEGVEISKTEAIKWIKLAAEQGFEMAKEMLLYI